MRTDADPGGSRAPPRADEAGTVLIWALFFVALTTGVLMTHNMELSANRDQMDTRFRRINLANQIARSGLTDATTYLRRQPVQPVEVFAPQLAPEADPPLDETLEPAVGLVRQFEVHGRLWGRYEVRNDEAVDVSLHYGAPPGMVWDIGSRGILYERVDPGRGFDEAPNRVVSVRTMRTEVRGVNLQLPADAAIVIDNPDDIAMLGNGVVDGSGDVAVAYTKQAVPVLPALDPSITGSPTSIEVMNLDLSLAGLFGMREDRFQGYADVILYSPRQLRGRVVQDKVVYAPESVVLSTDGAALHGRMVLAIAGDLLAQDGNGSDFSGVVYVRGDAVIQGPFTFRGTLIVGGLLKVGGTAGSVSIKHDPAPVAALQNVLAQYRSSRDVRPAAPAGAFADPADLEAIDGR